MHLTILVARSFALAGVTGYFFEPIAVETLDVFNTSSCVVLDDLGRRITISSGEARETSFLYQRFSVLIQRYNAVLLHDSLTTTNCTG